MSESAAKRLERAMTAEFESRLWTITVAISVALIASLSLVFFIAPAEVALRSTYLASMFFVMHWAVYWLFRARLTGAWLLYIVTFIDFALLTYIVTSQPADFERALPLPLLLRFNASVFLYIMLASLVIYFRPMLILWGGVCGAMSWAAAIYVISRNAPQRERTSDVQSLDALMARFADPDFIDFDVQVQNVAVFLIVAGLLAITTEASMRLLRRQVTSERRAANLSRYLPAETVEALADRDDPFGVNEEREAAILFTDIVGFSTLAETRSAREVIALLTEAHGLVEQEVHAHHGVLDKFIGDGAMATFGATGDVQGAAANAAACALGVLAATRTWNAQRRAAGEAEIHISVGVHFGPVVVGDVGAARRTELAVIGDTVNVAARLETMTRQLNTGAAISNEVMQAAGHPAGFDDLGLFEVKGRQGEIRVWGAPA